MAEEDASTNIVEEFPAPPFYYKHFTRVECSILPPAIPSAGNPYIDTYNGSFAYVHENTPGAKEDKGYKVELKSVLHEVMDCCMELIFSRGQAHGDFNATIEQNALRLRTKLADFHAVLHEYREVEAMERLISELSTQLRETEALEASLQSALAKSEEALRALSPGVQT